MSKKVYELITQKIIEKLEKGVIPWKQPFSNYRAVNWRTQRPYRGINVLLLEPGEYATFKQIKESGGKVKKGEKSHIVVFWRLLEKEKTNDEGETEITKIPLLRYYRVFEINTQCEGLKSKRKIIEHEHDPIQEAEEILSNFEDCPRITNRPVGAWYKPKIDLVNVPDKKEFISIHEYYSTLFHELIHSTGHESRLNRDGVVNVNKFGSEDYSKEELVAEIGASMLCGVAGIENETIDNSASYIQSWLRMLKNDHTLIVKASQQAQKACDYILHGKKYESEN